MPNQTDPLPLTIISGYLGSGKTTLVNHILRNADGKRIMVLVNDFGELPIDADLILSRDGDTINLANGCACCSMGGDLFNALVDVLDMNPRPDHLLIEASGVADPARIANIAQAEPDLTQDAIISLIDAETFEDLSVDGFVGETVTHQIISSDIILLNKLDLVDNGKRSRLDKILSELVPAANKIETEYSKVPLELVIGMNFANVEKQANQLSSDIHGPQYCKWSKTFKRPLDRGKFENALDKCANSVLRLKGIVKFDGEETLQVVQCVGSRCTITPAEFTNAELGNSVPARSRLVAIGLAGKIDQNKLDSIFDAVKSNYG